MCDGSEDGGSTFRGGGENAVSAVLSPLSTSEAEEAPRTVCCCCCCCCCCNNDTEGELVCLRGVAAVFQPCLEGGG